MPIRHHFRSVLVATLVTITLSLMLEQRASAADGTMTWGIPMHGNEVPVASAGDEPGRARLATFRCEMDAEQPVFSRGRCWGSRQNEHFFVDGDAESARW